MVAQGEPAGRAPPRRAGVVRVVDDVVAQLARVQAVVHQLPLDNVLERHDLRRVNERAMLLLRAYRIMRKAILASEQ